ncbi:MAG: DinB family protein [Phycisphaerae bacterium]
MRFNLRQATAILERTPAVLSALLRGLGREWTHANYGPDTFSPYDVIGHLIHGERTDWLARAEIILSHGESRPFDRYDRYAQFEVSRGRSLNRLLNEFARLRRANLARLRSLRLTPRDLGRAGTHPVLGRVTLRQLLATWVAHDLNHLSQIARCMAVRYAGAVGPWREALGVFRGSVTRMDADGAARRRAAQRAGGRRGQTRRQT